MQYVIYDDGAPSYLSSLLGLGRFSRHRFITVPRPSPSTSLRGDATVYRGIRLWNVLPSPAKSFRAMSMFKREAGQFLSALEAFTDLISIINFIKSSTLFNNLIENTYFLFS
jgi:hypothetical protein